MKKQNSKKENNMKKTYTKKQIKEAISYWEKQLKSGNYRKVNEQIDSQTNTPWYYFIVMLNGRTIFDARQNNPGNKLCWSDCCEDCVPDAALPQTPSGEDPYTEHELYYVDAWSQDELDSITDDPIYWPTLADFENQVGGVPGTVSIDHDAQTVTFRFG